MTFGIKKMAAVATAALTFAAVASAANAAAWSSQGYGTIMYQTNWVYWGTTIQPVGSIPATATISSLSWSISSSSSQPAYNAGKRYRLCHNTKSGTCVDTSSPSGSSSVFNGYAANKPFQIGTFVSYSSTVSMTPTINVGTEQVIVNYNY
ncbi:flagellar protein FlhE [Azospirillum palustre]|nr:flagellar protein FlhE [Azospirillum palustre]